MELGFLNYSELKDRFENFESLCDFLYDVLLFIRQLNRHSANENDINFYFTQMVKYIDQHYSSRLYLKDLAAKFFWIKCTAVSCSKNMGKTFSEYVTELRINKACELLKHSDVSVEEVALKVGIMDYYYFNKVFKKQCGITPAKYRKSWFITESGVGYLKISRLKLKHQILLIVLFTVIIFACMEAYFYFSFYNLTQTRAYQLWQQNDWADTPKDRFGIQRY